MTVRRTIINEQPLLKMILSRLHHKNQNFLVLVVGPTGSGKSSISIRMCELIDPHFDNTNICMNTLEFMTKIDNAKKGSAIVFEELGVSADAAEWWSLQNKVLKYITQTFRTDNLAVFYTVPDQAFIDKKLMSLFHAIIETDYIDYKSKIAYFKMYSTKKNYMSGNEYKKYYKFWGFDSLGQPFISKYSRIGVHLPSEWLINEYEIKRSGFSDNLKDDLITSLTTGRMKKFGKFSKDNKDNTRKRIEYDKFAKEIAGNLSKYTGPDDRPSYVNIMRDFNIGVLTARLVWRAAKAYES